MVRPTIRVIAAYSRDAREFRREQRLRPSWTVHCSSRSGAGPWADIGALDEDCDEDDADDD
jgi:hypothetical protein